MNTRSPSAPSPDSAPDDDALSQRAGIQSVEVGFDLLSALAAAPSALMLRDLAAAAGMSAAKAHRYLVSFQRLGLVVQDPATTRYDLGPAALRLGLAGLARLDGVRLARERADALLAQTGHTMAVAVWGNQGPTVVHWAEAPQTVPVTLRLGDVMPLLSSATGRCFAAFMDHHSPNGQRVAAMIDAELAQISARQRQTNHDLPRNAAEAQALLAETRARGLARVVHSLLPGVAGFCAPVFDAQGRLVLGLVVLGSVGTLDTDWDGPVAAALLACARQLSADLGHRG